MIKLPKTFTVSVPIGIERKCHERFSFETRNLATLPINPPRPTNSNCFISSIHSSTMIYHFFFTLYCTQTRNSELRTQNSELNLLLNQIVIAFGRVTSNQLADKAG